MAVSRRNAPCLCGSGKKAKSCCGTRSNPSAPSPGASLHRMDERLVDDMLAFANRRFGRDWFTEPMLAYCEGPEFAREDLQLFMPWVIHHWRVEGQPLRDWFLAERGRRLTEAERAWLLAQALARVTVWEVREVRAGEGLLLKDLLGGETRFVHEVSGSQMVRSRDAMLGRVVDHGGLSLICGVYPRTLPPAEAAEVVQVTRKVLKAPDGWVPREKLASEGTDLGLIHLWKDMVRERDLRPEPTPVLRNTDNEEMLLTMDHFSFAPEHRERVLGGLLRVKGAELDVDGVPAEIVFLKKGNAIHKSWECTVVGRARVEEAALRLETNSVQRADVLRARVEEACAGLLQHRAREHSDPQGLLVPRHGEREPEDVRESEAQEPELLAALREFKARHYADWLDTPLPALGGKTPREAVRTAKGRRKIDVLLKEFEHHEARLPRQQQVDFSSLRDELGLTE
jgi:hypothetical protein